MRRLPPDHTDWAIAPLRRPEYGLWRCLLDAGCGTTTTDALCRALGSGRGKVLAILRSLGRKNFIEHQFSDRYRTLHLSAIRRSPVAFLRGGEDAIAFPDSLKLYGQLSASEYTVYRLLHDVGPMCTVRSEIAGWARISCDKASKSLKTLDAKCLIRYTPLCSGGVDIWWVDGHGTLVPPKNPYSIQLEAANGDRYRVSMGKYKSFAKTIGIHPASFYALKDGRVDQHKGWKVV